LIWLSTSLWGAKITAAGSSVIWTQSGDYNTIQAFDISGDGNNNTVNGNLHGLILHGQFNHVLKNHVHNIDNPSCTSTNHVSSQGIDSDSVSGNFAIAGHNEISGNVIHDIGWPNTTVCNGSPAIYFGTPFGVAENNIIYRIGLSGIHMWHASTNMVVANNFMFQISAAANGTFVGYCILGGDGDTGAGIFDFSTIINNVCRDSQAIPLRLNGTTGPHNLTSKMLIFNMGSNNVSCTATDCTGFTNGVPPNNSIIASPLMVNFNANPGVPTVNANGQVVWPNADYHLQSGSPAINAGTTVCASGVANCVPSTDFSGKTRSAPIDIGAYEF